MGLIDGAVDGFFKGKDWREGVEDRKRRRKIEDEQLSWDRENQQWRREDRADTLSERNRTRKRRDEEEQFWKDLAAGEGGDAPPKDTSAAPGTSADAAPDDEPKPAPRRISLPDDTPTMPQEPSATAPAPAAPSTPHVAGVSRPPYDRRADAPQQDAPTAQDATPEAQPLNGRQQMSEFFQQQVGGQGSAGGNEPAPNPWGLSQSELRARQLPPAEGNLGPYAAPLTAGRPNVSFEEWRAMSRQERAAAGLPVSEAGGQWHYRNRDGGWSLTGEPDRPFGPAAETRSPRALTFPEAETPVQLPGSARARGPAPEAPMPKHLDSLANDPRLSEANRLAAAKDARADEANQEAYRRTILAGENASMGNYSANQPAPLSPPSDAAPVAAPATQEGTPARSIAAAIESAPAEAPAPTSDRDAAPAKPTGDTSAKAAAQFVDSYHATEADKIRKFYMSRGEPEKAKAYSQWIKDENVSKAMGYWAEAVHAATIGDDDRFVRSIARAYNAKGYYDDGYSIVPSASGIHRDQSGQITGAQVTFKDNKTGKVFTQEFDNSEDLYRLGVNMLAPEQVFEHGYSRVKAADGIRDAVAVKLAEKALSGDGVTPDAVLETMKKMSAANAQFSFLSLDEQVTEALKFMQGGFGAPEGGAAGNIPIAARPQG